MIILRKILPRRLKSFLKISWHKLRSRNYPYTPKVKFPLEDWKVNDVGFLEKQNYSGVDWGEHLGEDCIVGAGTPVFSIGRGRVVYSALHTSEEAPESEGKEGSNWGNIVIIAHKKPETKQVLFSVYGHLKKRLVEKGDRIKLGQSIGEVAPGWTKENGWWKQSHLHLAIYTGPWKGIVLPGTYRGGKRTKKKYWEPPTEFIEAY